MTSSSNPPMPDDRSNATPEVIAWGVLPPPIHGQSIMNDVSRTGPVGASR